jgi:hypothetical protein
MIARMKTRDLPATARRIYPEPLSGNDTPSQRHVDREIIRLLLARAPLIGVTTYEESRALGQIIVPIRDELIAIQSEQFAQRIGRAEKDGNSDEAAKLKARQERLTTAHPVIRWSSTHGLEYCEHVVEDRQGTGADTRQDYCVPHPLSLPDGNNARNPVAVLLHLSGAGKPLLRGEEKVDVSSALFVFCDLHAWLDREDPAGKLNLLLMRALRDLVQACKHGLWPRGMILLSSQIGVPHELSNDFKVLDYPLPTQEQLRERLKLRQGNWKKIFGPDCICLTEQDQADLVRSLAGLTYEEADVVLRKGLATDGYLGRQHIAEALAEKQQIIKKDGTLEYFVSGIDFAHVGGLNLLQRWLGDRKGAFLGRQLELLHEGNPFKITLPIPRGILLIGVPGGGKSLVAKAIGHSWGLPLLRLDVGRLFGAYVGESERNMRNAIRVAESVAPAVVWLDEIEKAFPKTSSSSDSGTSARVMSTFLTWMQERRQPVFVVATGNDISQLPPELSRKGRFDEIFYVGLPEVEDRKRIFAIHTRQLPLDGSHHRYLAEKARWYTGAEIEQVVTNSLYRIEQFVKGRRAEGHPDAPANPAVQAILDSMRYFIPLAMRKGDDGRGFVEKMLVTASLIAVPASSRFEQPPSDQDARARFDPEQIASQDFSEDL